MRPISISHKFPADVIPLRGLAVLLLHRELRHVEELLAERQ
jgi:hypothetical protein